MVGSSVLFIDHLDSFSWNLVQSLAALGADVEVRTHLREPPPQSEALSWTHLVLGPGPGRPEDTGFSLQWLRRATGKIPVLGVCLGMQLIASSYGASILHGAQPVHGHEVCIRHKGEGIFRGLPDPLAAGRYHSLVVEERSMSQELEPTAWSDDGVLMGLRHRLHSLEAVQFHPESVLSPTGDRLLGNFLTGGQDQPWTVGSRPAGCITDAS
jgi:anthranilate synthase component 2